MKFIIGDKVVFICGLWELNHLLFLIGVRNT